MTPAEALGLDGPWKGHYSLVTRSGKLLAVEGPGWYAEAAWEKRGGEWVCVAATCPVDWMLRQGAEAVKLGCEERGLKWRWR